MSAADDRLPKPILSKETMLLTAGLLLGLTLLVALLYGRICHAGFTLDEFIWSIPIKLSTGIQKPF
jgi:hypothetical protein